MNLRDQLSLATELALARSQLVESTKGLARFSELASIVGVSDRAAISLAIYHLDAALVIVDRVAGKTDSTEARQVREGESTPSEGESALRSSRPSVDQPSASEPEPESQPNPVNLVNPVPTP
jgi:hypothetical protein